MAISPLTGKPADPSLLINVPRPVTAYYTGQPDPSVPAQRVVFGTFGQRGSALDNAFNEAHILAITQAICLYRNQYHIDGPLYLGIDTHAFSEPAFASALEVLAANGVDVMIDADHGFTPTPVISHAILTHNRGRKRGLADGIVITPSHNPPRFGGFKYDPPHGGPADAHVTDWIERQANALHRRPAARRSKCFMILGAPTRNEKPGERFLAPARNDNKVNACHLKRSERSFSFCNGPTAAFFQRRTRSSRRKKVKQMAQKVFDQKYRNPSCPSVVGK